MYPLPLVLPRNEFFWTSGADGVLRLQRCGACDSLQYPPTVVCRYCRSPDLGITEVSGRGVVVGVSVNHQQWTPGAVPPYVLGSVALAEDPRVRISTTIVDCAPDDVFIGMRVAVGFQQNQDVWVPTFAPTGDQEPAPLPPLTEDPAVIRTWVRPLVRSRRYEHESAITGVGASQLGRRLMVDPLTLTIDACRAAIDDAGLTFDDIDGIATYPGGSAPGGFAEGGVTALEDALRLRPVWYNGGPEQPGPGGSVVAAMLAVAAGLCRHVLCYRTVWQATHAELLRAGRIRENSGRIGQPMDYIVPMGMLSVANLLATNASHYLHRYGATRETLGWIALNARANAALHPNAVYRTPLTMDDYLSARIVSTPFGLYDCDVPCDGAIAVIVSAADVARDMAGTPVWIDAVGTQISERMAWDQGTLTHEPQVFGPAAHMWSRSAYRPADVDFAELYDGFTFNCLSWLEGLGFCGIGEAKDFLDGGKRIALDGELPLNTHGGQLSHGRTHGFGLLHEAVSQLRGTAGERQVADARVGVVSSGGLTPSAAMVLTNQR
ncbi:MAG TPA: OB-fold domain-containing protein [Pseudonocardiaceae bacterium]